MDVDGDDGGGSSNWRLSRSLVSDDQGVRAAACLLSVDDGTNKNRNDILVTGTQAGGMYFFDSETGALMPEIVSFQHNHAVTALCALGSGSTSTTTSGNDNGGSFFFASGCKDAVVRIFSLGWSASLGSRKLELVAELKGHDKPVTSLDCCGDFLVSGSWDGTAKVWNWKNRSLVATLDGHENAVCVAFLRQQREKGTVLTVATGSAGVAAPGNRIVDHAVRIWSVDAATGQIRMLHRVAQDHEGPVRDLTTVATDVGGGGGVGNDAMDTEGGPPVLLASCSNDGTVKLRDGNTAKADATLTFVTEQEQHPPMLLTIASVSNNSWIVAGAEDGHVVAWDLAAAGGGESASTSSSSPQVIRHPACVWMVTTLPNGDFVTCCQDGKAYVFTRDEARFASEEVQKQFDDAMAAATSSRRQGPSSEEVSKLPMWENRLAMTGRSEGQVQLFQENGVAIAAQWSATAGSWIKVGQVMGSAGDDDGGGGASGNVLNGVQYDHVLPIQVDQPSSAGGGVANLHIGYNNGENPFVAAQRFIDDHVLPQYHVSFYVMLSLYRYFLCRYPCAATAFFPHSAYIHYY